MRKIYNRIIDLRGNLITVSAQGVSLGEIARIQKRNGTSTYASVLRFDDDLVTLQVFENTRGISTGDKVTFLGREIVAMFTDSLRSYRWGARHFGRRSSDWQPLIQPSEAHYPQRTRSHQHSDDRRV